MVLDATANALQLLNPERLFGWHAALFPTGDSGLSRLKVVAWRDGANDRCTWCRVAKAHGRQPFQ